MPARIQQLASSFETIIYKYYGLRSKDLTDVRVTDDQEDVEEYIQVSLATMDIAAQIKAAAAKKTGCDRAPLMHYLAYGINLINTLLVKSKPLDEEEANTLKKELTQLLLDMKSLLSVSQHTQLAVNYNNVEVMIYGCSGCTSGKIMQEELFSTTNQMSSGIEDYITDIINAQQNALLLQEQRRLNLELLKLTNSYQALELTRRVEVETMRSLQAERRRPIIRSQQEKIVQPEYTSPHMNYSLFQFAHDLFKDTTLLNELSEKNRQSLSFDLPEL